MDIPLIILSTLISAFFTFLLLGSLTWLYVWLDSKYEKKITYDNLDKPNAR